MAKINRRSALAVTGAGLTAALAGVSASVAKGYDLVLTGSNGTILFLNGRGSYSTFGKCNLDQALTCFDDYAAWLKAGHGRKEDKATPEMRDLLIRAYRLAEKIAAGEVSADIGNDPVPLRGSAE